MQRTPTLLLFLLCIIGCHTSRAQNLISWTDKKTCLFGYKNDSGRWVIPAKYTYAGEFDRNTGIALVGLNDKYGLIDKKGKEILPLLYTNVNAAPVNKYTRDGKTVTAYYYSYMAGKKYGLIDLKGNKITPDTMSYIKWLQGDIIAAENGIYSLKTGEKLFAGITLQPFRNGYAIFWQTKKITHIYKEADDEDDDDEDDEDDDGNKIAIKLKPKKKKEPHIDTVTENMNVAGIIDSAGHVVLPAQFIKVEELWYPNLTLAVNADNKLGYIDNMGNVILPVIYDKSEDKFDDKELFKKDTLLYLFDFKTYKLMYDGAAVSEEAAHYSTTFSLYKDGKYGLGKDDGTVYLKPQFEYMTRISDHHFLARNCKQSWLVSNEGAISKEYYDVIWPLALPDNMETALYQVRKKGKYGIVNINNRLIVPAQYDFIEYQAQTKDSFFFIGLKGKHAENIKASDSGFIITPFWATGTAVLGNNDAIKPALKVAFEKYPVPIPAKDYAPKSYLLNKNGKVLLATSKYQIGWLMDDKRVTIYENNLEGVMDLHEHVIVPPQYVRIIGAHEYWSEVPDYSYGEWIGRIYFQPGEATAESYYYFETTTKKLGIMDSSFRIILPGVYTALSMNKGAWFADTDTGWIMYSLNGRKLHEWRDLPMDFGDFYLVKDENKSRLMDKKGNYMPGYEYDDIALRPEKLFLIRQGKQYGLMDIKGNILTPCIYDEIGAFLDNYAIVTKNGKHGIINIEGKEIIKPEYTSLVYAPRALERIYNMKNVRRDYYSHICFSSYRASDSIPGIKTATYSHMSGYYQLLTDYPDSVRKRLINNYLAYRFINQRISHISSYFDTREYMIRTTNHVHKDPPRQAPWREGHDEPDYCYAENYTFAAVPGHSQMIGIRQETISSSGSRYENIHTSETNINFEYLYFTGDSLKTLTPKDVFSSNGWQDIAARRLKEQADKNPKPESRYCTTAEMQQAEQQKEYTDIRNMVAGGSFEIVKGGLKWTIRYGSNLYSTILNWNDLAPYLTKGSKVI